MTEPDIKEEKRSISVPKLNKSLKINVKSQKSSRRDTHVLDDVYCPYTVNKKFESFLK